MSAIQTQRDALEYLYSFVSYEQKANWSYNDKTLNLERFKRLLEHLGDPQFSLRIIHTAGSDGKGSVCAMLSSVLRSQGRRVGLYTSPHLHRLSERIQIDGNDISPNAFVDWTRLLQDAVEHCHHPARGYATFFELLTAMAYLHFQREQVDFAIIETGLGGRLDATNSAQPIATIITRISMEHKHLLGDTLEKIADEKLGIVRANAPVIIGPQEPSLLPHFKHRLRDHPAPAVFVDESYWVESLGVGRKYRRIAAQRLGADEKPRILRTPLLGGYQIQNAVTALAALDILQETGESPPLSQRIVDRGFRETIWPGRFEIIRRPRQADVVLDVAHTPKGAAALRLSLDERYPNRVRHYLLGFLHDKDPVAITAALLRPQDRVIYTQAPSPRGMTVEEIANLLCGLPRDLTSETPLSIPDPDKALQCALQDAQRNHVVVVAGSLYLVGLIRERILATACRTDALGCHQHV